MTKRLHARPSFEDAVAVILDDAVALHGAEFGNVQLAAREYLVIAVQRGFKAPFLEFFSEVRADGGCACGRALRMGHPIVIEDTEADEEFAPYRAVARAAGFRGVTTTPLLTRKNILIGTVSTYFVNVHAPTPIEIETLRSYSVIAAEFLHHLLGDELLEARASLMSRRLYATTCPQLTKANTASPQPTETCLVAQRTQP